jgi:hypothetical protein
MSSVESASHQIYSGGIGHTRLLVAPAKSIIAACRQSTRGSTNYDTNLRLQLFVSFVPIRGHLSFAPLRDRFLRRHIDKRYSPLVDLSVSSKRRLHRIPPE